MITGPTIYSRDSKGGIRTWRYEVHEADGNAEWRVVTGLIDGTQTVSGWKFAKPKNVGRANETTAVEQAVSEAKSTMTNKLKMEYRERIEDIDNIPFGPMLAADFKTVSVHKKWKDRIFPAISQPKLDGIRAHVTKGHATSRGNEEHFNVGHIHRALEAIFEVYPTLVLDGELYNHSLKDDFNKITSVVRRQHCTLDQAGEAARLIEYHVYDCFLPWRPDLETRGRLDFLRGLPLSGPIKLVPSSVCIDQVALDNCYGLYMEDGYEGQMVRIMDGTYEQRTRSNFLLKNKEFITEEFKVLRVEEGKGNWASYAKRVVIQLPDGRECGAGVRGSQAFLKEVLENKSRYERGEVTVRYFGLTPKSTNAEEGGDPTGGMPRFPVVTDFHPEGRKD